TDGNRETANRKAEYDHGHSGAQPGKKRPLVRQVIAGTIGVRARCRSRLVGSWLWHESSRTVRTAAGRDLFESFLKQRTDAADILQQFIGNIVPLLEIFRSVVREPDLAGSVFPGQSFER